jgi:hypothetical protein
MTRALVLLGLTLTAAPAMAQDSYFPGGFYSYYGYYGYGSFNGDADADSDSDSDADADADSDSDSDADAQDEDTAGGAGEKGSLCSAASAVGGWAALAVGATIIASRRRRF